MICAEIFRNIPLYSDYGFYPGNTSFGPFHLDVESDLAEMVTDESFYYTNHTQSTPAHPEKLRHLAGWGNSPMVQYDGTGAYFLDKMSDGLWRLEVMPDVIWIDNLFGWNNLNQKRAVIKWETRKMNIHLPDLGPSFKIGAYDSSYVDFPKEIKTGEVELHPGSYLLASTNSKLIFNDIKVPRAFLIYEYNAPKENIDTTYIIPHYLREYAAGRNIEIEATVASNLKIDSVVIFYSYLHGQHSGTIKMNLLHDYQYQAQIPYRQWPDNKILCNVFAYSGQHKIQPFEWRNGKRISTGNKEINLADSSSPIYLFNAAVDSSRLNRRWLPGSRLVASNNAGVISYLDLKINGLAIKDEENPDAEPVGDYTMRHCFGDLVQDRMQDLMKKKILVVHGYTQGESFPVQVALVMKDGSAFGTRIEMNPDDKTYKVSLEDFKKVNAVLLPRPYPTFLPYYSKAGKVDHLDLSQVESLQISVGPGIKKEDWGKSYELMMGSVILE
jgi:hypothetical protein